MPTSAAARMLANVKLHKSLAQSSSTPLYQKRIPLGTALKNAGRVASNVLSGKTKLSNPFSLKGTY